MALVFTGKNLKLYNNETDGQFQIRYWDNDGKRKRNRVPKDSDPIAFAKKMDDILGQSKTLTVAERAEMIMTVFAVLLLIVAAVGGAGAWLYYKGWIDL